MEALRAKIVDAIRETQKYRSTEIDQIVAALVKVQAELPAPEKNKQGNRGKYADVYSLLDTAQPVCSKYGIFIHQHMRKDKGNIIVHSTLMHVSGQWLDSRLDANPIEDQKLDYFQARSKAFTYTKRHLLQAQLGMGGDED